MARWSKHIGDFIKRVDSKKDDLMLDTFFIKKNYIPVNEEERKEFEEFSLVISCMALLIHIAKADKIMHPEERTRIINDLTFQLEQRPFEYVALKEKFGHYDREIIANMFNRLLVDYELDRLDLIKIIEVIDMVYQNNPDKKYYILKLCYYCAYSDSYYDESEDKVIVNIAEQLKISDVERKRIQREVKIELKEI